MLDQKISNQVLTASNTAATVADNSQVALSALSAATVGAVGSQLTFAATREPYPITPVGVTDVTVAGSHGAGETYTRFSYGSKTQDFDYSAFGYKGHFLHNTRIALVDYNLDGKYDEAFGIAPNGTVWHAWNNSNGWHEMMNGSQPAKANNTDYAEQIGTASAGVARLATADVGTQHWASADIQGTWGPWFHMGT